MIDLLDVNLLVSLAWPNHVHHRFAQRWFRSRSPGPWATTPVTETGFVRISSNRSAIPTAVPPGEALALLARMRGVPGHVFMPDDIELVTGEQDFGTGRVLTHHHVTDAHLLAVARRHEGRLATFDRAVASMAGPGARDVLIVPTQV